ncbi:MAG: hydrogenase small subunit [Deltaproteobacteria bacterium]|nr:hydrogenase small subunit [Deltaproteobacteria bacterium]PWB63951.1 MAG: hydrogenase 2 small subunit [Deltaproteobacteria bacterium]
MAPEEENDSLLKRLEKRGVSRREFLRVCSLAAAAVGLPAWTMERMAEAAAVKARPSVIWLHFQECTGCTESLLRTSHPAVSELILDLVSLDYHETLFAASGTQAENALHAAMKKNAGKYVLVVEGSIPMKENGAYCKVGGRTAVEILPEAVADAGAIVAMGSCASWGGVASADPNPTGATGVPQFLRNANYAAVLKGRPIVTLPGCPPNPYNLVGTVLQYATLGTLPALDALGRPKFAYARTIHEDCPRRPHFDAGRFVEKFGDPNHRQGYCLYKTGCKGPKTLASCSQQHFVEVVGAWPIGIGHPCIGCTEPSVAFRVPLHTTVEIDRPTPPDVFAPIVQPHGVVSPVATGVAGLVAGALAGAGLVAARKLGKEAAKGEGEEKEEGK